MHVKKEKYNRLLGQTGQTQPSLTSESPGSGIVPGSWLAPGEGWVEFLLPVPVPAGWHRAGIWAVSHRMDAPSLSLKIKTFKSPLYTSL